MSILKKNQVAVIDNLIEKYKQGELEIIETLPTKGFNNFDSGEVNVFFNDEDEVIFIVVEEVSGTLCKVVNL